MLKPTTKPLSVNMFILVIKPRKLKTPLMEFQLQPEDATQLAGCVEGLQQEYPKARVSQYVIYCIL